MTVQRITSVESPHFLKFVTHWTNRGLDVWFVNVMIKNKEPVDQEITGIFESVVKEYDWFGSVSQKGFIISTKPNFFSLIEWKDIQSIRLLYGLKSHENNRDHKVHEVFATGFLLPELTNLICKYLSGDIPETVPLNWQNHFHELKAKTQGEKRKLNE